MNERDAAAERNIHRLFEVGVVLKGLNALLEIVVGTTLFFVNIPDTVQSLAQNELIEDPNDFLATHVQTLVGHLSTQTQFYSALYLLSHGAIKVFLVVGLLRRRSWAYPASLAVLALFVAYQVIKWLETHSIPLLLLTLFDLALMWLVWHEYRRMVRAR
jgi:uncharacterized membrane protein